MREKHMCSTVRTPNFFLNTKLMFHVVLITQSILPFTIYNKSIFIWFFSLLIQLILSVLSLCYALAWITAFQVILATNNETINKVGKGM